MNGELSIIDIVLMLFIFLGAGIYLFKKFRKGDSCSCSNCPDSKKCDSYKPDEEKK